MANFIDRFGANVFNDKVMRERLPADTYEALKRTSRQGRSLDPTVAEIVAKAMQDWALEMGATHYTHWFQPLTGMTAEKHDSFLTPKRDGRVIAEFSASELVHGEADASSLPNGGLRATFEARGYTAWDPTSYAFVRDKVLYIPTAYCSFGGQALDKKTPLLRSMQALSKQALRIVRLFGNDRASRVFATVGAEQEYFLVDKAVYDQRIDLKITGRTLFGSKPLKGQELNDHFFGAIRPRVQAYMNDLNEELWKLGVYAKTEHNETAPAQHEMAPVFSTVNIASDQNQLVMETLKRVADSHGMVCLLHEKPFAGINGSGKHNNYSLSTDTGDNLFEPGETPAQNAQFLLFLSAMLAAVDDYQDLLRITVASAGNDNRLGGFEAPPAIISVSLGDELTGVIDSIINEEQYQAHGREVLRLGVHILPKFPRDTTDRNRTSPFAFTGNKFEFRSPGSSQSISGPNVVLNTTLADVLQRMADELEAAEDFTSAADALIRRTLREHRRIVFNGNGYDPSWIGEAAERGLMNLATTADALPHYLSEKNTSLFERQQIYTREEVQSRYEVKLSNYTSVKEIEAMTMLDMARRQILPAALKYSREVAEELQAKKAVLPGLSFTAEEKLLTAMSVQLEALSDGIDKLKACIDEENRTATALGKAVLIRDSIIPAMQSLRSAGDALEIMVDKRIWPLPAYSDMLTSI